jgi:hypothetical protein
MFGILIRRPAMAGVLAVAAMVAAQWFLARPTLAAQPGSQKSASSVDRAVEEALRHEIRGGADRDELLQRAIEESPGHPAARWHSGFVKVYKRWVHVDDIPEETGQHKFRAAYYELRDNCPATGEGQRKLAAWCGRHGLKDQERAHLTKLLDLDPDDAEARRKLGYVNRGGVWISEEEAGQDAQQENRQAKSLAQWRPKLESIRRRLDAPSQGRRAEFQRREAEREWERIDDPAAIPAIEAVFDTQSNQAGALRVVNKLSSMRSHEASAGLARYAVLSRWPQARQRAVDLLKNRPLHEYVPLLLASMYTPAQARAELYRAANGRLAYREVLSREGQEYREEVVLTSRGQASPPLQVDDRRGPRDPIAMQNAPATAPGTAMLNAEVQVANTRICSVLAEATGQSLGSSPEAWWEWWNEVNEVFLQGEKPLRQTTLVGLPAPTVPRLAPPPSGMANITPSLQDITLRAASSLPSNPYNVPPPSRYECLVAGTPVWTDRGATAVEKVQVGDLVLSQDPQSGELTYKPVLRTTVRPPAPLVKIDLEDETITASGGHLFWIAGQGWVRARELQPGARLHGATGPQAVCAVSEAQERTTYNLIVADFHTYFAGRGRVLSHDNTVARPTDAIVPGLLKR